MKIISVATWHKRFSTIGELTYQDFLNLKEENKYNIVNPNSWSV